MSVLRVPSKNKKQCFGWKSVRSACADKAITPLQKGSENQKLAIGERLLPLLALVRQNKIVKR